MRAQLWIFRRLDVRKGFSELSAILAPWQRRQNRQSYLLQTIWLHHLFPARPESLHTPAYMGVPHPIKRPLRLYTARHTSPHQIKGQHCQFLFISMHEYAGPDPLCILVTPLTSRLTSAFSLRTTANAFRYMQASCTNKQAKNNEHVRQTCRTKTQPSRSLMVIKRAIVWSAKGKKQCAIEAAYVLAWQGWLMIRGTLQYPLLSL